MEDKLRIAMLIDCDNMSSKSIEGVLAELAKHGTVNTRRAYGDWNSPLLSSWIEKLHHSAIRPMQQFAYTKGKNATDALMIIDSMELLHSDHIDAFALMTSDSDFTPLVMRLRESGMKVFGFGENKTPLPFVQACSQFIYTEKLVEEQENVAEGARLERKTGDELRGDKELGALLRTAVEQVSENDGWAHLGAVGSYISNKSSFSSQNYGYRKLSDLVKASGLFELETRGDNTTVYIKDKRPQRVTKIGETCVRVTQTDR